MMCPTLCNCKNRSSCVVNNNSHRLDRVSPMSVSPPTENTEIEMERVNTGDVSAVSDNLPPSYLEVMENTSKYPTHAN